MCVCVCVKLSSDYDYQNSIPLLALHQKIYQKIPICHKQSIDVADTCNFYTKILALPAHNQILIKGENN